MASFAAEDLSNLPPYPEMIFDAIDALDENEGSNKTTISKYLEATYGKLLPESHSSILTAHLVTMRESGELIFLKNNYIKPGPDVPPKRGRGRPPKPKADDPAGGALPSSPSPRGRPSKPKDPIAAAIAKAAKEYPERRGRPPKAAGGAPVAGVKRVRGRPLKVKSVAVETEGL